MEKPSNFYKSVSEAKDVAKAQVGLSICMNGLKLELGAFKSIWMKYAEVWTVDRSKYIEDMEARAPNLKDYETELRRFKITQQQIGREREMPIYSLILILQLY